MPGCAVSARGRLPAVLAAVAESPEGINHKTGAAAHELTHVSVEDRSKNPLVFSRSRSQSFRQGSQHSGNRSHSHNSSNVNSSISANPLLPIDTGLYSFYYTFSLLFARQPLHSVSQFICQCTMLCLCFDLCRHPFTSVHQSKTDESFGLRRA